MKHNIEQKDTLFIHKTYDKMINKEIVYGVFISYFHIFKLHFQIYNKRTYEL